MSMNKALKVCAFALLLFCASCASAQIRGPHRKIFTATPSIAVTCVTGAGSFSGTSATLTIAPPSGSMLVVGLSTLIPANFTSLQTSLGANLTQDSAGSGTNAFIPGGTNNAFSALFHASSVPSGITNVKATFAAGTNQIALEGCYVTGLASQVVDAIDNTGHYTVSGTAWSTGAVTTSNANDVVFGFAYAESNDPTFTATAPFILGDSKATAGSYSAAIAYQIVSSTGSYTPAGTMSLATSALGISGAYK